MSEFEVHSFDAGRCVVVLTIDDGILKLITVSCSRNGISIRCSDDVDVDDSVKDTCFNLALDTATKILENANEIELTIAKIATHYFSKQKHLLR